MHEPVPVPGRVKALARRAPERRTGSPRGWRGRGLVALLPGLCALGPLAATAHPLAPALLELREAPGGRMELRLKTSSLMAPGVRLEPVLPARCREADEPVFEIEGASAVVRRVLDCGEEGLSGVPVGVAGLAEAGVSALVRVELADGRRLQRVLRPDDPQWRIPPRQGPGDVARGYLRLGVGHILTGPDHLLFVFGLLLLVGWSRLLLHTVTAFTLGHSATLCAAALGLVRISQGPVEVLIAASIFVLAVELARGANGPPGALRQRPWTMSFSFGLLHGLGFAGALAEVGLPQEEIPLALLSFNVGIEIGQIAFLAAVLAAGLPLLRAAPRLPGWVERVPVYGMGSLAAFWCIDRTAALF